MTQPHPLTGKPFPYFKPLFCSLPPPAIQSVQGVYSGQFTGPAWLRFSAAPSLALAGLGGWWGKVLAGDGTGHNLVLHQGKLYRRFPIRLVSIPSQVDGRPGLTVQYTPECPFPWPHVIDELRRLDEKTLLGLTIINLGFLRRLAFPFLLFPEEIPLDQLG
jgi:hypothetical protein